METEVCVYIYIYIYNPKNFPCPKTAIRVISGYE